MASATNGAGDMAGSMMMQERAEDTGLDGAIGRLDRAVAALEGRLLTLVATPAPAPADDALNAALETSRQREQALEAAGAEAARALGRAIAEIRSALGEDKAAAVIDEES